jgi:hypothetical protein
VTLPHILQTGDLRMTRQELGHTDQTTTNQPTSHTSRLEKELRIYAIAAAAAGVGIMALAQGAEAKVIAKKADIAIPINGGLIQFDINGDGIPDFGLSATVFADSSGVSPKGKGKGNPPLGGIFGGRLIVFPAQTANGVIDDGGTEIKNYAAALPEGITIGAGRHFGVGSALMAGLVGTGCAGSSFAYGNWKGAHPHPYLAVKFSDSAGNVHYGWVRISVTQTDVSRFNATIEGYAYETVPNKTILSGAISGPVACLTESDRLQQPAAPQAASLGTLALGAQGLTAWRREEEQVVA